MTVATPAIYKGDVVRGTFPKLTRAFHKVKKAVSRVFPELAKVRLYIGCPHALEKHSHHQWKDSDRSGKMWRAFMHTGHFDDTICVHPHAEGELSERQKIGMLFHEFGHIINDLMGYKNTQKNADASIRKFFGLEIKYEGPGRVQYIDLS